RAPRRVGLASTRIVFDAERGQLAYEVVEPQWGPAERAAAETLGRALPQILPPPAPGATDAARAELIRYVASEFLRPRYPTLAREELERVFYYRVRDAIGLGPIDAMLEDPEVEDVSCDGVGVPVYVYHARHESLRTNVAFTNEAELNAFVVRLAQRCSRSLNVSRPLLDGMTPEGHRVQATYAREVTSRGASFTIRRFRDRPFTPIDLVREGTLSEEMVAYLWMAAEHGDSTIVLGGPGAGKTSTLNAVALFIPPTAKIVSIEDTRELNLPHENWIPTTTRVGLGDREPLATTSGEIDMFSLLSAALRQRPSHILVGEVRGKEAATMFQAMSTGHATYATMHADSLRAMVSRLENPPIEVPRSLFGSLREVLVETLVRTPAGPARRLSEIIEVRGLDPESSELVSSAIFRWDPAADRFDFQGQSALFERIARATGRTGEDVAVEFRRRTAAVRELVDSTSSMSPGELWRWFARFPNNSTTSSAAR
ncbi:MAG: type II/IV secretion system ATPase subunit, partial [Thermoplasmata archaeon]